MCILFVYVCKKKNKCINSFSFPTVFKWNCSCVSLSLGFSSRVCQTWTGSYLHTVIVLISHDDSSLAVACHPCWTIKLTGPRTQGAELVVESTARFENLKEGRKKDEDVITQRQNFKTFPRPCRNFPFLQAINKDFSCLKDRWSFANYLNEIKTQRWSKWDWQIQISHQFLKLDRDSTISVECLLRGT